MLKPGQQAALKDDLQVMSDVDMEQIIAWKDDMFVFNNEPLTAVIQELSRWYNVRVEYQGPTSKRRITASVSRTKSLDDVLSILEMTGAIHYKITNKNVIISQ